MGNVLSGDGGQVRRPYKVKRPYSRLSLRSTINAIRSCLAQLLHEELLRTPTPPGSAAGNSRRGLGDGEGRRFVFWCVSTEIERREPATSR